MYVTVRRYEGIADSNEVARRVQEGFLPLLRQTPGFVDYYFADAGWSNGLDRHLPGSGGGRRVEPAGSGVDAREPRIPGAQPSSDHRRRGGRSEGLVGSASIAR